MAKKNDIESELKKKINSIKKITKKTGDNKKTVVKKNTVKNDAVKKTAVKKTAVKKTAVKKETPKKNVKKINVTKTVVKKSPKYKNANIFEEENKNVTKKNLLKESTYSQKNHADSKKVNYYKNTKTKKRNIIVRLLLETRVVFEAIIIALLVRSFIIHPFYIPSGSMKPTLYVGDYIVVSKYSYGYSNHSFPFGNYLNKDIERFLSFNKPKRGEIVVFYSKNTGVDYIKRIIGMPGDRIIVRNGRVNINGKLLKREFEKVAEVNNKYIPIYRETLPNGTNYLIAEINGDIGISDNTAEYIVPEGKYFMLGDNRDNSSDSRFPSVGFVSEEEIIGPARFIALSVKEGYSLYEFWKYDKMFRGNRFAETIR